MAFGLDLDRNTFPLPNGNDSKKQDEKKRKVQFDWQKAWNSMLTNLTGWGISSGDNGGMNLKPRLAGVPFFGNFHAISGI